MKSIVIIFMLLASALFGFSQNYIPYHNLVNEGDQHLYQHEFDKAAEKYYAAFELEEALPWDSYHLVYCLDQIDPISNELEMKRWLLDGSTKTRYIMRWLNIMPLSAEFSELFYYDIKLNGEVFTEKFQPILEKLLNITESGEMRTLFMDSIRVYYMNIDEKYVRYKALMLEEDSLKQIEFLNLIRSEGYPGERLCGASFASAMFRKMPKYLYPDFKKVLFEELKKGNMNPYEYGYLVGQISFELNGKNEYDLFPTEEESQTPMSKILENRHKIGMSLFFKKPSYGINLLERRVLLEEKEEQSVLD